MSTPQPPPEPPGRSQGEAPERAARRVVDEPPGRSQGAAPERAARRVVDEPALSLDERIRRAELRLIAREHSLKRRVDLLGLRVQEALQPRRYIAPAIGIAMASWALWIMLSRRRARAPVPGASAREPAAGKLGELPWMHLLPLIWPLLPAAWRARINPATAATVVSLGLPLAGRLFAHRGTRRR